jgi:hypothetical protein
VLFYSKVNLPARPEQLEYKEAEENNNEAETPTLNDYFRAAFSV